MAGLAALAVCSQLQKFIAAHQYSRATQAQEKAAHYRADEVRSMGEILALLRKLKEQGRAVLNAVSGGENQEYIY